MSQTIKLTLRQISETEAMVILDSAQGEADHTFDLPWLDVQEWNVVFLYLKAFKNHRESWPKNAAIKEVATKLQLAQKNGMPLRQRVEHIGRRLYQTVLGDGKCERLFQRAFHSYQGGSPIVELHFPEAGHYLQTYPWEVLHDGSEFLFDSLRASLVRYIDFGQPLHPLKGKDTLNILLVDPRPKMPSEYAQLPVLDRTTLKSLLSKASSQLRVQELDAGLTQAATFDSLHQALNQFYGDIRVIHIDAHGEYGRLCEACDTLSPHGAETCQDCGWTFPLEHKEQGYIAFAKAGGSLQWISGQQLGKVWIKRGIQLVVLSVCNSGLGGGGSVFNSIAGALVKQGIPAVVAMQFPVEAVSTQAFIASFYQMLLNDVPLTEAIAAARTSLLGIEDAWYRPVLYLRTDPENMEGRIFELDISTQGTIQDAANLQYKQPDVASIPQIAPDVNLSAMRRKLDQRFDDAELDSFCMDYFSAVYDKFGRGMRRDEKINLLLDYCRRVPSRYQQLLSALQRIV